MTNQQRKQQIYQAIANQVLEQLNNGTMPWRKGWKAQAGTATNAITKNAYKGVNAYLNIVTLCKGYESNEWLTFNQVTKKGWKFKKDSEGRCLARDNGCPIIFYEQYDKKKKAPFTMNTVKHMTDEEKFEYIRKNVSFILKSFTVFNASLVEDYVEKSKAENVGDYNPDEETPPAETIISQWEQIVPIFYGGGKAYYSPKKDEIHLPERKQFLNVAEFYSVAFHEIAHSTGADNRLQRGIANSFGTKEYAFEELIAEFTSAFLRAELGITGEHAEDINNTASYIDSWRAAIKEKPDCLIEAIKKAEEASNYINNAIAA